MVRTMKQEMNSFFYTMVGKTRLNPLEAKRFAKFTVVGFIGAAVDSVTFNVSLAWLGLTATLAGALALVVAIISNFIWNRYWTYPDSRNKAIGQQFVQFFLVNLMALAIRLPILHVVPAQVATFVHRFLPAFTRYTAAISNNFAWALAVGIAMFWNFFINRYWTYNDVDSK